MATLSPTPWMHFDDDNGDPLVGGKVYTYASGTDTPLATYTNSGAGTENANPVILNSRGEANIWLGTNLYRFKLYDADDNLIATADNVGGLATQSSFSTFQTNLLAATGSSLVGFSHTTPATAGTVGEKLQQEISVKDAPYSATGDGSTDDTAAIQAASTACATAGKTLFFPAGTYLCTGISISSGTKWRGESSITTILKLKNGTDLSDTEALVNSTTITSGDFCDIRSMKFDGNKANNASSNCYMLRIKGSRPTLEDIQIVNSPGGGILTDYNGNDDTITGPYYGVQPGTFRKISISQTNRNGWYHRGPSDSGFDHIMICDAGVETDSTYYGLFLDVAGAGGNGRFNDLHNYNLSGTTNVPTYGVYVGTGGNTFTNCFFEGGDICLGIDSFFNSFDSCIYTAPRGDYAVFLSDNSVSNKIGGVVGAGAFAGNPNFTGIGLSGAGHIIDVVCGGAITPIEFIDVGDGGNFVRMVGSIDAGGTAATGTAASNDDIEIVLQGTVPSVMIQHSPDSNEFITAEVTAGNAVSLTTDTPVNLTSISIPAGSWDLTTTAGYIFPASTAVQALEVGPSPTSATFSTIDTVALYLFDSMVPGAGTYALTSPLSRLVVASTTTVYLVIKANFSVSTLTAYGTISARKVR